MKSGPDLRRAAGECPLPEDIVAGMLGELSRGEMTRLAEHLEACGACRAIDRNMRLVLSSLQASELPAFDGDLAARVMPRIPAKSWKRGAAGPLRPRAAAAPPLMKLAAGVLVLLGACLIGVRFLRPSALQRSGTSAPETGAVARGVAWLISKQQPEGGWDAKALGGKPEYGVALNGLAVLALARNRTATPAELRPLRRGAAFLMKQQSAGGRFGPDFDGMMYNHGIATLAALEAYRVTGNLELKATISAALAFIRDQQSPAGGWGYRKGSGSTPNISVSAWQVQALLLAARLGWREDHAALRRGLAWMTGVMDGQGFFGYEHARHFPEGRETLTTMGAFCALEAAREAELPDKRRLATVQNGLEAVAGRRSGDYYDWYFQSAALRAARRADLAAVLAALEQSVRAVQETAGNCAGSWRPSDRWGEVGGWLYSTSMAVLALTPAS